MFAIFMKSPLITKLLLSYKLITTGLFNASAGDYSEGRTAVYGKRYNTGVTFATKADAEEAVLRAFDRRTPFTCNTFKLTYCVDKIAIQSTITQIAPKIFLFCKHIADHLCKLLKEKDKRTSIYLQQSDRLILEAKNPVVIPHPEIDIALVKLEFDDSETAKSDFLPIAKQMCTFDSNGYVVSYSDVSVIDKEDVFTTSKALSIHPFQYRKTEKKTDRVTIFASRKNF